MDINKTTIPNNYGERLTVLTRNPAVKNDYVVITHGFGCDMHNRGLLDDIAHKLVARGYTTVQFSFSGCGYSKGNFKETSLTKQKKDLDVIMKDIVLPHKPKTITMINMSFSGPVSIVRGNKSIDCMILLSAPNKPYDSLSAFFEKKGKFDTEGVSEALRRTGETTYVGPQFWSDLKKYDLNKLIKKIKVPLLLIYGKEDTLVTGNNATSYFLNANEPKQLVFIEGADHSFEDPRCRREMIDDIVWFLNKYIQR